MAECHSITPIAHIKSDFPTKFGIPRQSGLVEELQAAVIFEPEYRNMDAFRGLEEFSHIWLIWQFSQCAGKPWSPTVRPPRLGGNKRMGVFATRSPFRPNPIGLSPVRLIGIEQDATFGPVLRIAGADLMDGTPIYDIKPYIPYVDCRSDATGGFTDRVARALLDVDFPAALLSKIPSERQKALLGVLANDPRPSYQKDPQRVYGLPFADFDIKFTVEGTTLHVCAVDCAKDK